QVNRMLQSVVKDGTGKPAAVPGYVICGKTGSSQVAEHGHYVGGKFVASFIGVLPTANPRLVIMIAVNQPQGTHWGATVAAPVFHQVAQKAMFYWKVPP